MRAEWRYAGETGEWVLAEWAPDGAPLEVFGSAAASSLTAVNPRLRERVADAMLEHHGIRPPAEVFDGPPGERVTLTCPACWAVSFDPERARSRVCGACGAAAVRVPRQRDGDGARVT